MREEDYKNYRLKYPIFRYKKYDIKELEDKIEISYLYEIEGLETFNHIIQIEKNMEFDTRSISNLVFNLGLVELVSYWKATCSPNVIIECGYLNEEQIAWFKKLYFNGLGEMFYRNGITNKIDDFMNITCTGKEINEPKVIKDYSDYIIPVGGGKDSCVTLESLKNKDNLAMIVNPRNVTLECAKIAEVKNVIKIYRKIDPNLINLNKRGFLNGHTPFSAMIAFLSTLVAYMTGRKYIALSNESSANEANVDGTNVNHQYSKTLEFENDYRYYCESYLNNEIEYFSFLRPILEVEIAYLFSKLKKYHHVFKSCNVGSKEKDWVWCCNCSKCLFVYTILSPFLYKDELVSIFGEDLFAKEDLKETFIDLLGYGKNKPFDCVGTYEEVRYAVSKTILNLKDNKLPYLLEYYKDNYEIVNDDALKFYTDKNNLNQEQTSILKGVLYDK